MGVTRRVVCAAVRLDLDDPAPATVVDGDHGVQQPTGHLVDRSVECAAVERSEPVRGGAGTHRRVSGSATVGPMAATDRSGGGDGSWRPTSIET